MIALQRRDGRAAKATVCKTGSGGFNSHSRLQFAPLLEAAGFPSLPLLPLSFCPRLPLCFLLRFAKETFFVQNTRISLVFSFFGATLLRKNNSHSNRSFQSYHEDGTNHPPLCFLGMGRHGKRCLEHGPCLAGKGQSVRDFCDPRTFAHSRRGEERDPDPSVPLPLSAFSPVEGKNPCP